MQATKSPSPQRYPPVPPQTTAAATAKSTAAVRSPNKATTATATTAATANNGSSSSDDAVAFQFNLGFAEDDLLLTITESDVSAVLRLAHRTSLSLRDPGEVGEMFIELAKGTLLTKQAFDSIIRDLVPGRTLLTEEKECTYMVQFVVAARYSEFSVLLCAIFFAFDRDGSGSVDAYELAAGFSLLCCGNKSAKLAYAFELLDEEGLGYLNRRGVWRFMRSVLSALLGLSTGAADLTAEECTPIYDAVLQYSTFSLMSQIASRRATEV
eukprot:5667-Heterococcus_DN1.PRE.2